MSFVHLNSHSHYSLLDALGTPKALVKAAVAAGCTAIALTDNSYLYGAIEFYKACKEAGIKPIIGCEVNLVEETRFDKSSDNLYQATKLTILAKNFHGYQNLLKLSTAASLEGFSNVPRIDFELLKKYKEGLIVLSGDKNSLLSNLILSSETDKQIQLIEQFKKIFTEDFYLEIQRHPETPEYLMIEKGLLELSKKTNTPLVATHGIRYLKPEDNITQDILVCIGTQTNIYDPNRKKYTGDYSFQTPAQMEELFKDLPEACQNTLKITEQCDLEIPFGLNLIPQFKTPDNFTSKEYLRQLCEKGLKELYSTEKQEESQKQLDYELEMVDKMGFNDYFLIVWDFIHFARTQGISVGPGRGSAAGAIIAYTLKITELDPLHYGLIFERFLNPYRISMPDIDIDFSDLRRDEVLQYTINKYGRDCVSQVITYGTMSAKSAVRDVGRGMGYPYSEVDAIAKAVPQPILGKHAPLKDSIQNNSELNQIYQNNTRAHSLLDNAINIEGTVRHAGTHACAVIISETSLVNYTPLQKATDGSEGIITQYSMKYLEEIGLLKMDFLGLKNLTIIENTLNLIKKDQNIDLNLNKIPMNDLKTFDLFQKGDTTGIFQLESPGMRHYLKELKPTYFEDIIAMISLYRPGPMLFIPTYINGKHKPETVKYLVPAFTEILKETYGVAVYQEQILQIARIFAGFSFGEADILRRAVGKKDPKLLEEQRSKFIDGAIAQGYDKKLSQSVFDDIVEPFAGYGFNKSHAACYAMISYRTAYLKANFSTEFMAALITSEMGNSEKVAEAINDCDHLNIEILPPSINESNADFTVISPQKIRFGLTAIKGVGEGPISEIISSREKYGPFNSIEDFAERLPSKLINKKIIESLAYSGALDQLGERQTIAENVESISKYAKDFQKLKDANQNQTDLFGDLSDNEIQKQSLQLKESEPLSRIEKLFLEKDYLGLYASGHPLKGLSAYLKRKAKLISNLSPKDYGKTIKVAGLFSNLRTAITKSGTAMAYGEIEDATGKLSFVVFPKIYEKYKFTLKKDQVVIVQGKIEERRGEKQISIFEIKNISLDTLLENAKKEGLYNPKEKITKISMSQQASEHVTSILQKYLKLEKNTLTITIPENLSSEKLSSIKKILQNSNGQTSVILQLLSTNKSTKKIKLKNTIDSSPELLSKLENVLT